MLRQIKLHGSLGEKFGKQFTLDVQTPAEAVRALCVQLPGFEQDIRQGEWVCLRGQYEDRVECDSALLQLRLGSLSEFHIIPAALGRKSGFGKILIGIALIAAVVVTGGLAIAAIPELGLGLGTAIGTFGIGGAIAATGTIGAAIAGVGALMILGGVAQMLAPTPSGSAGQSATDLPGYNFNGAANTSQPGSACPLVFGRIRAGSVTVSAGIIAERIGAANTAYSGSSTDMSVYSASP